MYSNSTNKIYHYGNRTYEQCSTGFTFFYFAFFFTQFRFVSKFGYFEYCLW